MKYSKYILLVLFYALIILYGMTGCNYNNKNNKISSEAEKNRFSERVIKLNNEAMDILQESSFFFKPVLSDSVKLAISLLNKAILIDSTYYRGYFNLSNIYYRLSYLDSALVHIRKLIHHESDLAEGYTLEGLTLWEMDQKEKALQSFIFAKDIYKQRIISNPENALPNELNVIFLNCFIEGRDSALQKLEFYYDKYPDDTLVINNIRDAIYSFDSSYLFMLP